MDTIKTKSVTVDAGGTTFPASLHASGAAVAKSPATLAAGDVTGNLPADVQTIKARAVADYGSGHVYYVGGDNAANGAAGGIAIVGSKMDLLDTIMEDA